MSDFVHRTETDSYARGCLLGKGGPADLEPAKRQRVLGVSASPRYLGAALVADGRVLRLFAQRLSTNRATQGRAAHAWVADLARSHLPRAAVIIAPPVAADATTSGLHELLAEACRALGVASACVGMHEVGSAHGLDAESVIEIARHMAAHDPTVASYLAPRGHGPRSEAERYWEHAALAAAAALAIRDETPSPTC